MYVRALVGVRLKWLKSGFKVSQYDSELRITWSALMFQRTTAILRAFYQH